MMEEKLMTIGEVARYLNIPENTVRELVEKGNLPAYKIAGSILRFKKEQVDLYRKRFDVSSIAETILSQTASDLKLPGIKPDSLIDKNSHKFSSGQITYTFFDRIADFIYYNDFYIASLAILAFVIFAIIRY